jgi:S1-C subfamily serine protease
MQILIDITIGILTTYLAVTNSLADQITNLFPSEAASEEVSVVENHAPRGLAKIVSAYLDIPQILIDSTAYQNASVINTKLQTATSSPVEALVNIFCTYTSDEFTKTTTGTGYFIDSDGIILTNAHVAQFLLLEGVEGSTDCIIRTGNPAEPAYEADLLYISPAWVQKHAKLINQERPRSTGERDYALLYITAGLTDQPLPQYFPALSFDAELMRTSALDTSVFAAGYPAETLFASTRATAELVPRQTTTSIKELMTFGSNYADIFTVSGSDIGEQGSSGGPIVNQAGDAIGLISTRGDDSVFGTGSLRALTISYIDRTIQEETGFTLRQNLGGNLPFRAQLFKDTLVPFLRGMLERELEQQ